jgi:hypothetical protein
MELLSAEVIWTASSLECGPEERSTAFRLRKAVSAIIHPPLFIRHYSLFAIIHHSFAIFAMEREGHVPTTIIEPDVAPLS